MGVTSTKVFQCLEEFSADQLVKRLKKFSRKDQKVTNPETGGLVTLRTTIERVRKNDDGKIVRGYMQYDSGVEIKQRQGPVKFIVRTNEVPFSFVLGSVHFVPFASGAEANVVAQKINQIVFGDMEDLILGCNITPPRIEDFLERNPNEITNC